MFRDHSSSIFGRKGMVSVNMFLVLFLMVVLPLWGALSGHTFADYATDVSISDVLVLSNQERAQAGSQPLVENQQLMTAAHNKATNMFAEDYWAHNSPEGATPWDFISAAGYHYAAAAENLAEDFSTSTDVVNAWMNSPLHRLNLLNPGYHDVGIAVMNGTLLGEQTTLVVMEFGQPAVPPATPATTQTSASPPIASQPTHTSVKSLVTPKKAQEAPAINGTQLPADSHQLPIHIALVGALLTMTWLKAAVILLCVIVLCLTYLKRRPIVWRVNKRLPPWTLWLRAHPMLQINLLSCAAVMSASTTLGVVR